MDFTVNNIALSAHADTKLAGLTINTGSHTLPTLFRFEGESFFTEISSPLIDVESDNKNFEAIESNAELVVFDQIRLAKLAELVAESDIELVAINAINSRNHHTSIRFDILTKDLQKSRIALAKFNQDNGTESAILVNAPKLSMPGLLVMDMDSTTIKIECIDEIAKLAGVGEQVAAVTEQAMQGKLDFAESLHSRVATLTNAPVDIIAQVKENLPLMEGLESLIKALKVYQWRIAIASGGFTYFADHLKEKLGLDAAVANQLEINGDTLTGKVLGDVVDAQAKATTLSALAEQYNIPHKQTVAMGDGANDLVMMAAASLGVAFEAKPVVTAQADVGIQHSGLDCLLHWLA